MGPLAILCSGPGRQGRGMFDLVSRAPEAAEVFAAPPPLGIARLTFFDETTFRQEVETIIRSGPKWPGRRLHSLTAASGFEFIDGSGSARWNDPGKLSRRLRRC